MTSEAVVFRVAPSLFTCFVPMVEIHSEHPDRFVGVLPILAQIPRARGQPTSIVLAKDPPGPR